MIGFPLPGTDSSAQTANSSPTLPDWTWDEMIGAFRALGGVAENIRPGRGPLGRGLFARDPARPILLRVPETLLFPIDAIEFVGERMRIRESARIAKPQREFFERYENAFSWGDGGGLESAEHIAALDALPPEVRALLIADFGMGDLFEGDAVERTRQRFLKSRLIVWNKRDVVMPLIELANHHPLSSAYKKSERGLEIQGMARDEVLICYGPQDALAMFHGFGFASPQPGAFSLVMNVTGGAKELVIERNTTRRVRRDNVWTPQLSSKGNKLVLSFLMIGNPHYPRLSRGTFGTLMGQAGVKDPDEVFDLILHLNWTKFLRLLAALEPHQGRMIVTLRQVARFQLEGMSHCIGTRKL
jgi:hypothetical protein